MGPAKKTLLHAVSTLFFLYVTGLSLWYVNFHASKLFRYDLSRFIWDGLDPYTARIALLAAFALPLVFSFRHQRDYFGPLAFGAGLVTVLAMAHESHTIGHPNLWGWEPDGPIFGITVVVFVAFLLLVAAASLALRKWHPFPILVVGGVLLPVLFATQSQVISGSGFAMSSGSRASHGAFTYIFPALALAVVLVRSYFLPPDRSKPAPVAATEDSATATVDPSPAKQANNS